MSSIASDLTNDLMTFSLRIVFALPGPAELRVPVREEVEQPERALFDRRTIGAHDPRPETAVPVLAVVSTSPYGVVPDPYGSDLVQDCPASRKITSIPG